MNKTIATIWIMLGIMWSPNISTAAPKLSKSMILNSSSLEVVLTNTNPYSSIDSTLSKLWIISWWENNGEYTEVFVYILEKAWVISFPNNSLFPQGCNSEKLKNLSSKCDTNFYIWEPNQNKKLKDFLDKNKNKIRSNSELINKAMRRYIKLDKSFYDWVEKWDYHISQKSSQVDNDAELKRLITSIWSRLK